jgi:hypothetical protein
MLSEVYAECWLRWMSFMPIVIYAECGLCWVSIKLKVVYAECQLCWVSIMLKVVYAVCAFAECRIIIARLSVQGIDFYEEGDICSMFFASSGQTF